MRAPTQLKIKFKSATIEDFIDRYSVDVSRHGIFIRSRNQKDLDPGTPLRFEFTLQDGEPLMTGEGTVAWTRVDDPSRPGITPGIGVRFDHIPGLSVLVLDQILAEKDRRGERIEDSRYEVGLRESVNGGVAGGAASRGTGPISRPTLDLTDFDDRDGRTPLPSPMPGLAAPRLAAHASDFDRDESTRVMQPAQAEALQRKSRLEALSEVDLPVPPSASALFDRVGPPRTEPSGYLPSPLPLAGDLPMVPTAIEVIVPPPTAHEAVDRVEPDPFAELAEELARESDDESEATRRYQPVARSEDPDRKAATIRAIEEALARVGTADAPIAQAPAAGELGYGAIAEEAPPLPAPADAAPAPEPFVPEPLLPESSVPEPFVPEPFVPEPLLPEPLLPEPFVPEPSVPEPSVPEPSVPEPSVPEPLLPEPFVPDLELEPEPERTAQGSGTERLAGGPFSAITDFASNFTDEPSAAAATVGSPTEDSPAGEPASAVPEPAPAASGEASVIVEAPPGSAADPIAEDEPAPLPPLDVPFAIPLGAVDPMGPIDVVDVTAKVGVADLADVPRHEPPPHLPLAIDAGAVTLIGGDEVAEAVDGRLVASPNEPPGDAGEAAPPPPAPAPTPPAPRPSISGESTVLPEDRRAAPAVAGLGGESTVLLGDVSREEAPTAVAAVGSEATVWPVAPVALPAVAAAAPSSEATVVLAGGSSAAPAAPGSPGDVTVQLGDGSAAAVTSPAARVTPPASATSNSDVTAQLAGQPVATVGPSTVAPAAVAAPPPAPAPPLPARTAVLDKPAVAAAPPRFPWLVAALLLVALGAGSWFLAPLLFPPTARPPSAASR